MFLQQFERGITRIMWCCYCVVCGTLVMVAAAASVCKEKLRLKHLEFIFVAYATRSIFKKGREWLSSSLTTRKKTRNHVRKCPGD